MEDSDAVRLSVLETHREDDLRRINLIEKAVSGLVSSVQTLIESGRVRDVVHAVQVAADRRLLRWGLTILGVIVSVSSIWQAYHEATR